MYLHVDVVPGWFQICGWCGGTIWPTVFISIFPKKLWHVRTLRFSSRLKLFVGYGLCWVNNGVEIGQVIFCVTQILLLAKILLSAPDCQNWRPIGIPVPIPLNWWAFVPLNYWAPMPLKWWADIYMPAYCWDYYLCCICFCWCYYCIGCCHHMLFCTGCFHCVCCIGCMAIW